MVWESGWEDVIVKIDELAVHVKRVGLQLTIEGKVRVGVNYSVIENTFW